MTPDDLMDGFERAWSARKLDRFESVCTDDIHYEDPLTPEPLEGIPQLQGHAERLWAGFPDARLEKTGDRLVGGRFIAAPFRLLATHKEELEGLAATNRFVIVHGILYSEMTDDGEALRRVRAFFDVYGAATQLGVLPKPGSFGEKALLALRGFGLRGAWAGPGGGPELKKPR